MEKQYDFAGWATRHNVKCSDGRTIMPSAFQHCDGQVVPLVWNHDHKDPFNVLGHAELEYRPEGVYTYCAFNDTEQGKNAKELVQHGDVVSLSIYANRLKQRDGDVLHGEIREVSLVLASANPEAHIDMVMAHGEELDDEATIYAAEGIEIFHAEETNNDTTKEKENMAEGTKTPAEGKKERTIEDVYNEMTDEQQTVVKAMLGMALEDAKGDDDNEEEIEHSEGGTEEMKSNVFDQTEVKEGGVLTHADQTKILENAKKAGVGTLQEAIRLYMEDESLSHGLDLGDTETLEELLPDHHLMNPGAPELYGRPDQSWVAGVISKIKKSPYARVRTRYADATIADFKAKGYKKGEEKKYNDNIKLIGRKTEPTTVYRKEQLNRDDIIDITDFDVVNYTWMLMKEGFMETVALAALVGDGREVDDPDKINEESIRPIWKDAELYTHHVTIDIEGTKNQLQGTNTGVNFGENFIYAESIITKALYAREKFKGSGTPDLYCTPHMVNVMLLARDLNGRRIYDSKADLARALNVNSIVEIEQLEGRTRKAGEQTKKLLGLFVNLGDYQFGSTKGGELTKFSDFDIDFNKYKYLMETRLSGALVKLDSAIALEEDVVEEAAG